MGAAIYKRVAGTSREAAKLERLSFHGNGFSPLRLLKQSRRERYRSVRHALADDEIDQPTRHHDFLDDLLTLEPGLDFVE